MPFHHPHLVGQRREDRLRPVEARVAAAAGEAALSAAILFLLQAEGAGESRGIDLAKEI